MSRIARLKFLAESALKEVLPGFRFADSEESVGASKTPLVALSSDAGTDFETTDYGTIRGRTSLKVDVYLCLGRDLGIKTKEDTDTLQNKVRKSIVNDKDICREYLKAWCSKIMAMDIPGENNLRVLCHDFEVSWLDV
ncbi:MAG: hypothetical protein AB8G05_01395 [Oligoflexales bacterium]